MLVLHGFLDTLFDISLLHPRSFFLGLSNSRSALGKFPSIIGCQARVIRTSAIVAPILAISRVGPVRSPETSPISGEGNPPAISSIYHVYPVFPDPCAQQPEVSLREQIVSHAQKLLRGTVSEFRGNRTNGSGKRACWESNDVR